MSKLPLHRLTKKELVWLATHHCKEHGHNFLEHYSCYEPATSERVGFLDIETTSLDADFGIMLSYCLKVENEDKIYEDVLTANDIAKGEAGDEDKRIVRNLVGDLHNFDKIVTFYGTRFDVPFIRTRAVVCGVPFPHYGSIVHKDIYFIMKNKFKLSSNRLENSCRVLLDHTDKTRIEKRFWRAAARGDQKSLEYVLEHNRYDVTDLEALYHKVINYSRQQNVSI